MLCYADLSDLTLGGGRRDLGGEGGREGDIEVLPGLGLGLGLILGLGWCTIRYDMM